MNSVISAFKGKKSSAASSNPPNGTANGSGAGESKQNHGGGLVGMNISIASVGSGLAKKKTVAQSSGYQYLRHIREIETANKLLSPVVVVAEDRPAGKTGSASALATMAAGVDLVDHCMPATVRLSNAETLSDFNMNGKSTEVSDNANLELADAWICPPPVGAADDEDLSEHSTAACTSTSSSSEHSNSTVVRSPTVAESTTSPVSMSAFASATISHPGPGHSPSLSQHSTSSSAASCGRRSPHSQSSLAITCEPHSTSTTTLSSLGSELGNGNDTPAFLIAAPVTLAIGGQMPTASSAASTPKLSRYPKPRLSLSREFNYSMPSVHGRPNLSVAQSQGDMVPAALGSAANPPKRISTHQRNLSLDFRSMGILLPPVSQVTNTRINHTQHHRNRSLDSALQRIPEVEVSSPNAEGENTFCSPSILGANMCSKIATTAASVSAALSPPATPTPAMTSVATSTAHSPTTAATKEHTEHPVPKQQRPICLQAAGRSSTVVVESCPVLRVRPKSSESVATNGQEIIGTMVGGTGNGGHSSNNSCSSAGSSKKREDLTSLGSDDSGIICGSESDQISLNRICQSHESLDSGEMDADADADADAEEECVDLMETTSIDEEYNIMQPEHLCFFPPHASSTEQDCRTLRPSRKQKRPQQPALEQASVLSQELHHKGLTADAGVDARTRYRVMNMSQAAINVELGATSNEIEPVVHDNEIVQSHTADADLPNLVKASPSAASRAPAAPSTTTTPTATPTPTESSKNDPVLFKNFFGATKNAIFRTAQSIIENHEKKNAAKQKEQPDHSATAAILSSPSGGSISQHDQVKSPTDISKKKEFFSLLTSNSSKKAAAAAAAAAASSVVNTPVATPTESLAATADLKFQQPSDSSADSKVKERTLNLRLPGADSEASEQALAKSSSINSLHKLKLPVPGVVKYFISERAPVTDLLQKPEKGQSGLLRFFESPVFNIHFAVHYLFYSKEPGVLSFIGNKIFSFPDQEVDLYIPQLIVMYIQMDELAEVLDPYLTIRCRKSVDFSLKCLWLLEAYNYQVDPLGNSISNSRKTKLALMKEIFSKKEQKQSQNEVKYAATAGNGEPRTLAAFTKKTHHRSQSDATVLLADSRSPHMLSISQRIYQQPPYTTQTLAPTPAKLCLGDLTSGHAFDNGCTCFESVRGQVNGLLGQRTLCSCGAPKTAPQKEFMKALINVGKNLTSLSSKAEKTSALRMFLNLINKNLPARVWLPLYSDISHHVVRITEEKTAVLNSKDKTPYIIYVEVVEVPDIYTSPLIPKMMPSLRHTKSEEHLEGSCLNSHQHLSCSRTSSCSSSQQGSSCRRKKTAELDGGCGDAGSVNCYGNTLSLGGLQLQEDDVWSQEDDEITAQYLNMSKVSERDTISQMSLDSCDSRDQGPPIVFNIGDVRLRHCSNLSCENTKSFSNDPEDPSAAALKEPWHEKEKLIRESSPYGHLSNWRLLSAIVKCGDDLRQELMATQLLQMFKIIWHEEHVDLWVRPYKIVCLSNDSGLIEPILNTVSLHQIKKNSNKSLRDYFIDEYGTPTGETFRRAQKNFVQSCAAYCLISYLLQVKDRHNGNILFHSDGHIIHIDFGFILSISPKNLGFEQSPFKLTPEFVEVMGGTSSEHWREFNRLLLVGMMSARKHMDRIINFVEIMRSNAHLPCFKNGCSGTVQNLRKRFHMNLTEQEMERKVEQLVQDSLKSLSTKLYDGYQYYTNGIL
ncbi:pneumococcal serine-rich repeat protein [Drosophila ficusphila]|uniref:pneumococcal serine-rich repeat protein n=1 Tax=Drosophila ficusphila TaxID=30025 RepID=UPI0007E7AC5B|nr:pneumococcal serine-rich repeat protein [Drosophila ficusphila]XP_017057966.1 pneumococcal serine-rich repeat protein [Drosophila ficusphila]